MKSLKQPALTVLLKGVFLDIVAKSSLFVVIVVLLLLILQRLWSRPALHEKCNEMRMSIL